MLRKCTHVIDFMFYYLNFQFATKNGQQIHYVHFVYF